jgi:hypothetical protein
MKCSKKPGNLSVFLIVGMIPCLHQEVLKYSELPRTAPSSKHLHTNSFTIIMRGQHAPAEFFWKRQSPITLERDLNAIRETMRKRLPQ